MAQNPKHKAFNMKKAGIRVGIVVLVLLLIVLGFLYLNPAYSASPETIAYIQAAVAKQQQIDQELRSYYQAGKYTFTDPMLIQDPYQSAPLTALLVFDTPAASQISIHVPGKTSQSDVDFTSPGYQKHHELPIYGLYAASLNHVTVTLKTQNGESVKNEIDLQTEPLPATVPEFQVDKVDPLRYDPGFNFAFLAGGLEVFDIDGNVRWYSTKRAAQVFSKLQNGRFMRSYSTDGLDGKIMMEEDLLGKIYAAYTVADGIHHEIYELPSGNLLITSSDLRSNTTKDYLIEVNRKSGHIVKSIDFKDILDPGRPHQVLQLAANDWLHMNSIVYDPSDRSIIISCKAQSAVVKLSYPGMQIKWILGPQDNWSQKYQPYLLKPVGNNFDWFWSQHHATLYSPDPSGNLVDLLLFDNGNYRSFSLANAYPPSEWYSKMAHYRIDEAARTVELVWEYGRERGPAIFSAARGSAYHLANGDVLGTWGDIYKDAQGNPADTDSATGSEETKIIEVDPSTNAVVFESSAAAETYRAMRLGMYAGYSEVNDYFSTALNDTTGNDLADRSVMAWRDLKRWTITPFVTWLKALRHSILQAGK